MFKKVIIHTKKSIKMIILSMIATFLIVGVVAFLYKPTYSVSINGEQIGYTSDKSNLQKRINEYIENGDGGNTAFVQVENLPEYKLCLLKKGIVTNDDEIYENIKNQGIPYYKYYAILENGEEKIYVSTFEEAESIINQLKEKNSKNKDNISIAEKYETQVKDFVSTEEAISKLYVEPPKDVYVAKTTEKKGTVNTSSKTSSGKVSLGLALIKPVSGTITSRFGASSRIRVSSHTGLDIATAKGTPIKAAASGTVTFSGTKGSYGKLIVISHGNGVETYYGHCSSLLLSAGTKVSQGDVVALVGSTGNSTGNHLHFEIRVNGIAYNPENYVY